MEMSTQGTKWSANYVQKTTQIRDFIRGTRNLVAYVLTATLRAMTLTSVVLRVSHAAVGLRLISGKVHVNEGNFTEKLWADLMEQCLRFRSYTLLSDNQVLVTRDQNTLKMWSYQNTTYTYGQRIQSRKK
jgi:hypothetical protein